MKIEGRNLRTLGIWVYLILGVSFLAGVSSAIFLVALEFVGQVQRSHTWLVWGLPFAGLVSGAIYLRWGKESDGGNNLVIHEIVVPQKPLPWLMAPLVLGGTLLTHLFGGSAGREGTAVQMAASLSDTLARPFRITAVQRSLLLRMAVAAGFSAVFGTPLAGAVFAMEWTTLRRLHLQGILPILLCAYLANEVVIALDVHHTIYNAGTIPQFSWLVAFKVALSALAFGGAAWLFVAVTRSISVLLRKRVSNPIWRPALGGGLVLVASLILGQRWLGLGIPLLSESFVSAMLPWDWIAKLGFTALTVGSGFKGGEVTPLFVIGATLGNTLAPLLALPMPYVAALGFVAVFAAAARTPLACTLMALELFGGNIVPAAFLACVVAYSVVRGPGIYAAQGEASPPQV